MKRVFMAVLLALWAVFPALASSGEQTLRNGARVIWDVGSDTPQPRLGLSAPAFVTWGNTTFQDAATFEMRSNYAAFIDQWQLVLYRAGDTARKKPIKVYRGASMALSKPVIWRGEVDSGPALRPGEQVIAVLSVRDAAGNIDEVEAQSILVARYLMHRETRKNAALTSKRQRYLRDGSPFSKNTIPVRGHSVALTLSDWKESAVPLLSGMALREEGADFKLDQILPGGRTELVVQVARPLLNGVRAIPVGSAILDLPFTEPMFAYVKGTGKAERRNADTPLPQIDAYEPDGWVDGGDAAGFMLVERDSSQGRSVIAMTEPAKDTPLYLDPRKRRYIAASYTARDAVWSGDAGQDAPVRAPADPRYRSIKVKYPAGPYAQLFLPHLDIQRSSLQLYLAVDGAAATPLVKVRHFFADATEGRVLLTEAGRKLIRAGIEEGKAFNRSATLSLRYNALRFVGTPGTDLSVDSFDLSDNGESLRTSYADFYRTRSSTEVQMKVEESGLIQRIKNWFFKY